MSITVNGIFLRPDFTELITERFALKYFVDLSKFIYPFGYYDQYNKSVICNKYIPDGLYIILGKVEYPGKDRYSYHTMAQFIGCKSCGADLVFLNKFNSYIDLPEQITPTPVFPMFKVGELAEFTIFKKEFKKISNEWLTGFEISSKLKELNRESIEYKIYALRLALLRFIKER